MQNMYLFASKFLKQVGHMLWPCCVNQKLDSIFSKGKLMKISASTPFCFKLNCMDWVKHFIFLVAGYCILLLTDAEEGLCWSTAIAEPHSSCPCPSYLRSSGRVWEWVPASARDTRWDTCGWRGGHLCQRCAEWGPWAFPSLQGLSNAAPSRNDAPAAGPDGGST